MIHYFQTQKTAKVVIEGEVNPKLRSVWLVAHGYGHLASYFINKLKPVLNEENLVIVPEGLHRYYLNGVRGRVGASWMTKEEREHDIADYCNYLDEVYKQFILPLSDKIIINVLGFSQGGATVCRWASLTEYKIDNLIIWGSVIPPDMVPITLGKEKFLSKNNIGQWIYVAGDKDEFLSHEQQNAQLEELKKYNINPETVYYQGGHDIIEEPLRLLTQKCVKKRM